MPLLELPFTPIPGVLGMHFVDNLVPLNLRIADNKTMEHLVCLLGFGDRVTLLRLEDLFILGKYLLLDSLHGLGLIFRALKIGLHFPSNFDNSIPGHFDFRRQPFFSIIRRTVMMWTR
jgi:hypothetical protein